MKCPKCQHDNPQGAKFCVECGGKLDVLCPACSFVNSPGFKFCAECGHSLSPSPQPALKDLSFDDKLAKIQKYLPQGLTQKILSQRDRIEGERKQVTVMFCDMEGYTVLSEKLGPEELYGLMDQVYEILIHKVHDYEGTVNELTGDGIMALFGAPIALEDAPQRSIRSALAIHKEITRFSERMSYEKGIHPIQMRIGINSGPVVVGTVGNDLRVDFKAIGDTVNLASRMESLAEPGATYVTEDTFRLAEGLFNFENLGERNIKGKDAPVRVYRVLSPSSRRTRFEVGAEKGLTPLIGRNRELDTLMGVFERAKGGRGQAVSIVSDAGVGKSRVLHEFKRGVLNDQITLLEGRCLSYGKNVAYHPIIDMLKTSFNIWEEDEDVHIREKLTDGLRSLGEDEDSSLPYLLELLSVKDSGLDQVMLSPEGRKERIIQVLNRIVIKTSEIRPLIIAIEDLHWVDRSSQDVLNLMLENIPGLPIMLLFTYRPGYIHAWGTKSYHSQITLSRLSGHETSEMATHLLGAMVIDKDVETLILEKTEGNPLFVEEFVRALLDLKIIEKDLSRYRMSGNIGSIAIPSTIHDMIMSRVDKLPEGARDLLQTASAIEREFSYPLILKASGVQEKELLDSLSVLKNSELIYEQGIHPYAKYFFKHALTREVIYDSLLERKKRELHERIGNAIENAFEAYLPEHYGPLANHFMRSENFIKAAQYAKLAAKKNQKAGSLTDAVIYGQNYVTALEKLPRTPELDRSIIDARTTLGLYYNQTNNFLLSRDAVEPILDLVTKYNYKKRMAQIHTILGSCAYAVEEDVAKGSEQLQEAINASEATGDLISSVMANHWMGHVLADNCEFERSLSHLNKSLEISTMAKVLWGIAAQKSCIARTVYLYQGKVNVGYAMSCEGLQLAEESGDSYSKAEAHISMGWAHFQRRELNDAEKHLTEACNICDRLQFIVLHCLAEWILGETYFSTKQYGKSKKHFASLTENLTSNSLYPSLVCFGESAMAKAIVMNNEMMTNLDLLLTYADKNIAKLLAGQLRRQFAEILMRLDDSHLREAEKWIREAEKADRKNGLLFDLARDLAVCGEVYKRKGDRSKAKEALGEAMNVSKDCGADGWAKEYEEEKAKLA